MSKKGGGSQYDPQVAQAAQQNAATAARAQQFSEDFYSHHVEPLLQQETDQAGQTNSRLNKLYDLNIQQTQDSQARYNQYGKPAEDAYYKAAGDTANQATDLYNKYVQPAQANYEQTLGDLAKTQGDQFNQYGLPAQQNFYQTSAIDAQRQQDNYLNNALPAQAAYYKQARDYSQDAEYERRANVAFGDVAQAGDNQRGALQRQFASNGIGLNSPAAAAAFGDFGIQQASAQAAAANRARDAARSLGLQLTSDAGNFARGDTGGLTTAANAAQYAGGNTGANYAAARAGFTPSANIAGLGIRGDAANYGRGGQSSVLQFGQAAQGNAQGSQGAFTSALGAANGSAGVPLQGYGIATGAYGNNLNAYSGLAKTDMQIQAQNAGGFGQLLGTLGGAAIKAYTGGVG